MIGGTGMQRAQQVAHRLGGELTAGGERCCAGGGRAHGALLWSPLRDAWRAKVEGEQFPSAALKDRPRRARPRTRRGRQSAREAAGEYGASLCRVGRGTMM